MTQRKIREGDTVRVNEFRHRNVVIVLSFEGRVTLVGINGKGDLYYHVADQHCVEWHRSKFELAIVAANDNNPRCP